MEVQDYESSLEKDFRKQEGIFYSPNAITYYMLRQLISAYVEDGNALEALQNIRILDPSCGAGAFLLTAFEELLHCYTTKFPNYSTPDNLKKHIVTHNLFGVDTDPQAVALSQKLLYEKSACLCPNIKQGNSLYVCEVIGKQWTFVTMESKEYCVSHSYDCTNKEEMLQIIAVLRKFRDILDNRFLKDE
jgi:hypothetical protein